MDGRGRDGGERESMSGRGKRGEEERAWMEGEERAVEWKRNGRGGRERLSGRGMRGEEEKARVEEE